MQATRHETESNRITRIILEHAARISREQDLEQLIRLNADFARDLVGCERCSIWLVDEKTAQLWTKVAHGVEPIRIPAGQGLVGNCIEKNEVLIVNNAEQDMRVMRSVDQASGYSTKQLLCVPLRVDGRVLGALQALNKPHGFTDSDATLLGMLAHFAGTAIDSERLRLEAIAAQVLRRELELASDVQTRLLPGALAHVHGLECAGLCRPARSIGGDYYDLLQLGDGSFACTLGDVSGKGIPAAVLMASIQTPLRSLLQRDSGDLGALVTQLSRTLWESSTADRYSTLFCGVISPGRDLLRYVNAGHVPPFLLRENGCVERLETTGVPVGLLPVYRYEEQSIGLRPGDLLVVVSDGIVEAQSIDGSFWEEAAVEGALRENLPFLQEDVPQFLCRAADAWAAGAEQYDDMTAIAVRVLPRD